MKNPGATPESLYRPPKPDNPLTGRIDTGQPRPSVEQAEQQEQEKFAEIDERFKHLDLDIEAAQKKADDATVSHGLLGVGGSGR